MTQVVKNSKDGGLVKYWWDKPGKKDDPREKFSYVQKFEPWDWIIGSGAYVDDIENEVAKMKEHTDSEISSIIVYILIFSLISIVIAYIIYNYFVRQTIIRPLENLNHAIDDIKTGTTRADRIEKV